MEDKDLRTNLFEERENDMILCSIQDKSNLHKFVFCVACFSILATNHSKKLGLR